LSLILREEHRLRVLENRELRRIFGPNRGEVIEGWRKLHNEEPRIIRMMRPRRMRWTGHVPRMGEKMNVCKILVGKPEGKRPLGRLSRRWEDNIKMDFREIGYGDVDWIDLAQDRDQRRALVSTVMNLWVS
jgi:hypothetical protein